MKEIVLGLYSTDFTEEEKDELYTLTEEERKEIEEYFALDE